MIDLKEILKGIRPYVMGWIGVWTSYTVVWTGAVTNPVLGNGTLTAAYMNRPGGTCKLRMELHIGSTTTFGSGAWSFSLPIPTRSDGLHNLGLMLIKDYSTGYFYTRFIDVDQGASVMTYCLTTSGLATGNTLDASTPITWATDDYCRIDMEYAV
jgi:hypothetical protein